LFKIQNTFLCLYVLVNIGISVSLLVKFNFFLGLICVYVVSGLEVLCFLSHLSPLQNQAHITTIISTIHCMLQGAVFADV